MLSAKELRRLARQAGADKARHLELADQCGEQEKRLDEMADDAEAREDERQGLRKGQALSRVVNTNMDNSHRLAISRSRSKGQPSDPFSVACRKAKMTRGGLARALDIDPALLSRYRKGTRPIPQERADKVKALTGWPADKAHWPGGIVPLD